VSTAQTILLGASLPGTIGRSFIRAEDLVLTIAGLVRSPCRVWLSPRPRS